MGKFVVKHLNVNIKIAKEIQRKYYKKHGTTLKGLMDNHGVDPDHFLNEVPFYAKNHYQYLVVGFGADKKYDKQKRDKEIIFKYKK